MAEEHSKGKYGRVTSKNRKEIVDRISSKYDIAQQKEYLERKIDADIGYFRIQRKIDGANLDEII
jgi:hypothetical protein